MLADLNALKQKHFQGDVCQKFLIFLCRTTLAWVLFFIASNPEIEEKVVDELRDLGLLACPSNPNPRQLEFSDIAQLPYLKAVLKETMRLVPVSSSP